MLQDNPQELLEQMKHAFDAQVKVIEEYKKTLNLIRDSPHRGVVNNINDCFYRVERIYNDFNKKYNL